MEASQWAREPPPKLTVIRYSLLQSLGRRPSLASPRPAAAAFAMAARSAAPAKGGRRNVLASSLRSSAAAPPTRRRPLPSLASECANQFPMSLSTVPVQFWRAIYSKWKHKQQQQRRPFLPLSRPIGSGPFLALPTATFRKGQPRNSDRQSISQCNW